MRKRQRASTFCYFLLFFAQFFGLIEQQQNSPLSRHFFVPARQQAAQQLRSRAVNAPQTNGKKQFETITMPGGRQFVLVPRRLFLHQRQKFSRPSKPHFGLSKARNSHSPTPIHERNANNANFRSRQLHLQQRRGAIVLHLRSLLPSSLPPKQLAISPKQLPQIQSTSQKRIPLIQSKSASNPTKLRIPPKANIPPKMVPELNPNEGNNASRALEIKRRQEQFMKAQQMELKQIKEKQIGMEKEKPKMGKSRQKIVEKNGKSDELTKKERERELVAIQRQQKVDGIGQEIMRQIFRERTFSIATPPIPLQPQMVETTTPKINEKLAIGNTGTTTKTTNNHLQQNEISISSSRLPPSTPSLSPMPPPTTINSILRSSSSTSSTSPQIGLVTQTEASNAFPNPAPFSPPPISTSAPSNGTNSGGISPPAAAAPPGLMPPSDNIVAELNNANDFMEVANRHRLPELFASRRRLATSALAAVV